MNVNVKLSLTDEQRNVLKRRLTGKDVKAMISRKEVNELVQDFIASLLTGDAPETPEAPADEQLDLTFNGGHDDCCKANKLLLTRINRLQHALDTGRKS